MEENALSPETSEAPHAQSKTSGNPLLPFLAGTLELEEILLDIGSKKTLFL